MASVSQQIPFSLPLGSQPTMWNKISAGFQTTYGITENNYLFTWGANGAGQLGDGAAVNRSSPVQIGARYTEDTLAAYITATGATLNSWTQVVSTISSMAAIRSDGTLWTWGIGSQGELGNNQTILPVSYPTKLGSNSWSQVSAGVTHFAAIRADGALFTWGNNASGQLGDTTVVSKSSPVQIGNNSYIHVSAGASNTAAIDSSYNLWTWGNNAVGQLGTSDLINRSAPVQIGLSAASGYYSSYFDGGTNRITTAASSLFNLTGANLTLECWVYMNAAPTVYNRLITIGPNNVQSSLAFSITTGRVFDVGVPFSSGGSVNSGSTLIPLKEWTHLAFVLSGSTGTIYINGSQVGQSTGWNITSSTTNYFYVGYDATATVDGKFTGFVSNARLLIGTDLYSGSSFTVPTSPLTAIANTVVLTCQDSTLVDNSNNNFNFTLVGAVTPIVDYQPFSNPVITNVGPSWTNISAGNSITAALTSDGKLFTWGASAAGQVGQGTLIHRSSPVQVTTLAGNEAQIDSYISNTGFVGTAYHSWTQITTGSVYSFAIRSDGLLFGWGENSGGQLGLNSTSSYASYPIAIGNSSWIQVAANDNSSYAIRSDGTLWAWGQNVSGSLGTNDLVHRSSPVQIGTSSWTSVASGGIFGTGLYTLATRSDGALFAWGSNVLGQLGLNDRINRSSPVQVGTSSWTAVATGVSYVAAIRYDSGLFTWGFNGNGELGANTRVHRSSPVQVGTSSWSSVASGFNHMLALKATGALFTWGLGTTGQLGSNAALTRSSPVQVGTSSWTGVGAGTSWSFAIRTDGALFSWGFNTNGNLGVSDAANKSSPIQIGASSWTLISSSTANSAPVAIRSDGRLFQWGSQYIGNGPIYYLGNYRAVPQSSPVVITAFAESFTFVSAGTSHIAAIRSDNSMFTWGLNTSGQLGDNTIISRSAPTQITSSSPDGYYSTHFNTGLVTIASSAAPAIGTNDFTVEFWLAPILTGGVTYGRMVQFGPNTTAGGLWIVRQATSNPLNILVQGYVGAAYVNFAATPSIATVADNTWKHIALVRSSGTFTLYVNGVNAGSSTPAAYSIVKNNVYVGANSAAGENLAGYISNLRILNGTALYTSNFTPPTSPLTVISNTQILALQSSTLKDNSSNNYTITSSGTVGVSKNIPFVVPNGSGTTWSKVTTGGTHTVGLTSDDKLYTWGLNTSGQLGDGTIISKSNPVQLGSSTWSEVETSLNSTYAKKQNYALYGWGLNTLQFGAMGVRANMSSPILIGTIPDSWSQVAATKSGLFGLGVRADKSLFTWGTNTDGQLGDGTIINKSNPVQIGSTVPAGYYSNYFDGNGDYLDVGVGGVGITLSSNWTVECWFYATATGGIIFDFRPNNVNGYYPEVAVNSATQLDFYYNSVSNLVTVSNLLNTWNHVALVKNSGTLTMYYNGASVYSVSDANTWSISAARPRIGANGGFYSASPSPFTGFISNFRVVNGTAVYTSNFIPSTSPLTAITNTIILTCQGIGFSENSTNNYSIALTGNTALSTTYPSSFSAPAGGAVLKSWASVTGGSIFSAALTDTDELYTWGNNAAGNLGIEAGLSPAGSWIVHRSSPTQVGTVTFAASPVQVGGSSWTQVSAGTNHVLATRTDGTLFAWGLNSSYQLGDNTQVHRSSPVQVGSTSWTKISAGDVHSLAIANDSTLYGWGATGYTSQTTPYLLPALSNTTQFVSVAEGLSSTFGIKADGTLWAWGANSDGVLGTNDRIHRSSPVQIGTDKWLQVFSGDIIYDTTFALRSDGKIFTWGNNSYGSLGLNDRTHRSSPTQVGSDNWRYISASGLAIKSDYTLWGWGDTGINGSSVRRSSPVQIGTSSWLMVTSQQGVAHAIRLDSLLFSWGGNTYGQLGTNENAAVVKSSPTQVGTRTWSTVYTGNMASFAIDTNSRLWAWGTNSAGNLGLGDTVHRSSPVQVGTSAWSVVAPTNSYPAASLTAAATLAIRADGGLFSWGTNNGRLGTNDSLPRSSPVQVGTSSWTTIGLAELGAIATRVDGALFTWGTNTTGQVGNNSIIARSSPVQISATPPNFMSQPVQISTSSWTQVSAGYSHSLAIRNDNTLWGWGNPAANSYSVYSWTQISAGAPSLAIRSDGAMFAWGLNGQGQLGLGDIAHRSSPVQVGTSSWAAVASSNSVSAAIRADGGLFTWGSNSTGGLGDNSIVNRSSPVQIGTSSWAQLSTGDPNTMGAIRADGGLFIWGAAGNGWLGQNDLVHRSSPVQIGTSSWTMVNLNNVGSVAAAIRIDGALFTWGFGTAVGSGSAATRSSPVQVSSLYDEASMISYANNNGMPIYSWSQLSAGNSHVVALRADGALFTWGQNNAGQVGDNTLASRNIPTRIGNSSWSSVNAGVSHTVAVRSDGAMFVWGNNSSGQLGLSDLVHRSSPVQVGTSSWTIAATGGPTASGGFTIAKRIDGGLFAWGINANGQLGLGDLVHRSSPVQVGTSSWGQISAGLTHVVATLTNGLLYTWGANLMGMGDATNIAKSSPVQITSMDTPQLQINYAASLSTTPYSWAQISSNISHILAVRSDNMLFAWGINTAGQVGDSTITNKNRPTQIGNSSWTTVSAGASHSLAIRADGGLFTWGTNTSGELGLGDIAHRSSPVQVGTSSWVAIPTLSNSNLNTMAIRIDGALFGWGNNAGAPIGLEDQVHRSSPTQIGTSSWSQVSSGKSYTAAIRSDGGLFTWGLNTSSNGSPLGDNSAVSRSSPVQIGTSSWSQVSAGLSYTYAIRQDGGLFTWGGNSGGQLGQNDAINRSSPVQVGTSSWTMAASGSGYGSFAIRVDGALFAWGNNVSGGLGVGDNVTRSSPVQVGTSSWSLIGAAGTVASHGILSDGSLYSWGSNTSGLFGILKNITSATSPVFVSTINDSWKMLGTTATNSHNVAVRSDDTLWVWGGNGSGQLGLGDIAHRSYVTQFGTESWVMATGMGNSTAGIKTNKTLWTWGNNLYGGLGTNDSIHRSSPVQVGTGSYVSVTGGNQMMVAYNYDNNLLYGVGDNTNSQLGAVRQFGTTTQYVSSPVQVGTITDSWSMVGMYGAGSTITYGLAIRNDKLLFGWGVNSVGQLGLNDTTARNLPTQIGNSSWTTVASSGSSTSAIRTDGTLWIWGDNTSGQLGLNNVAINRSSPVQIGTYSWTTLPVGGAIQAYNMAVRNDGVLFTWGAATYGQLGQGALTDRSSPTQLGSGYGYIRNPTNYPTITQIGNSSWTSVSAGNNYSMVVRATDNVLFAWGFNANELLRSTLTNMGYSAVQVSSGTSHFGFIKKS